MTAWVTRLGVCAGVHHKLFADLTRKYFAERPVDTTNTLLDHSHLPLFSPVNELFVIRRPITGPHVIAVSTFSAESRRKDNGRLSQRDGILTFKFSYAVMFYRRANDKPATGQFAVWGLHLRAGDEAVSWTPDLLQRTRDPAGESTFGELGMHGAISHPTFGI
jgi:hypothetical protein